MDGVLIPLLGEDGFDSGLGGAGAAIGVGVTSGG